MTLPVASHVTVAELEGLGLFGALDDAIVASLAERLTVLPVDEGDIVFREGERGRSMFVVLEGELELIKKSRHGRLVPVATLDKGDWFGEKALLDIMPRAATARARTPARLLELKASDLDALYRRDLKAYSLLVMNLARQLSRKLRAAESILADTITSVMDHHDDAESDAE